MVMGYITGVFDGYDADQHWDKQAHYICLPTTITKRQLADIVKKEYEDNPASRHQTAAGLVLNALSISFPCN